MVSWEGQASLWSLISSQTSGKHIWAPFLGKKEHSYISLSLHYPCSCGYSHLFHLSICHFLSYIYLVHNFSKYLQLWLLQSFPQTFWFLVLPSDQLSWLSRSLWSELKERKDNSQTAVLALALCFAKGTKYFAPTHFFFACFMEYQEKTKESENFGRFLTFKNLF